MRHLISTRKRFVLCKECRRGIFFCYDGGMPVYVEPEPITPLDEIVLRLQGKMTFIACGSQLAARNTFNASVKAAIYVEHEHRNGFDECPIGTKKKAIDLSEPPF